MKDRSLGSRIGLAAVGLTAVAGLTACDAMADGDGKRGMKHEPITFSEVDANGDGAVDAAELLAWIEAQREARVQRMIERADTDGDGVLSEAELQEVFNRRGRWRKWH